MCIKGRHLATNKKTGISDSLFHFNHTYHIKIHFPNSVVNYELEFCLDTVTSYKDLGTLSKLAEIPFVESGSDVDNSQFQG